MSRVAAAIITQQAELQSGRNLRTFDGLIHHTTFLQVQPSTSKSQRAAAKSGERNEGATSLLRRLLGFALEEGGRVRCQEAG